MISKFILDIRIFRSYTIIVRWERNSSRKEK
uniref:Uncharacterized protein n=1 Tax=Siphoviridae sp. ctGfF74 TaxID=2826223 RepID=A0A8S5NL13_9CAUD|nr:MAG TPA: hypothetical protein [Siphoviridae sp. ctGfF74]